MSKITRVAFDSLPDPMNPRIRPIEAEPLVNPDLSGTLPEIKRELIGLVKPVVPEAVRREQLDALQSAIDSVNAYIRSTQANFGIQFELHQRSGLTYALIRNMETGRVLKQIPTETLLNIAARVRQASGIFANLTT